MLWKTASLITAAIVLFCFTGCASLLEEEKPASSAEPAAPKKEIKAQTEAVGGFYGDLKAESIGQYSSQKKKTREETLKKYKAAASHKLFIKIEEASVVPNKVKAGDKVEMRMTYAVLGAAPRKELTITEERAIKFKKDLFGKPIAHVTHDEGTYSSAIPVTLPAGAKKGTYTVVFKVHSRGVTASRETTFTVN